jgi:DNA-binding response OmpR family regulator
MNILYIEDEPMDAELVQRYIQTTKHRLIITASVEEAYRAFDTEVDLVLLDIMLQDTKAGYSFVQELRNQGYEKPVVAITGLAMASDIEKCYRAGFTDVLTKPYAIKELVAMFSKYVY